MEFVIIEISLLLFVGLAIYGIWGIYKANKRYENIKKYWPVKHHLDSNGYLQYSVDGVTWTYVMGFEENFDYGKYKGPGFGYIKFNSEKDDNYKSWCNMLNSMQECHKWNTAAMNHYIEAVKKYLNK